MINGFGALAQAVAGAGDGNNGGGERRIAPAGGDVEIADGEAFKTPATIDDPAILDEIRAGLAAKGIGA